MLGGELLFHFMNVMLLTALVAPLVLWRYRRAVLAGMQHRRSARRLPLRAARSDRGRAAPAFAADATPLAWEARHAAPHLRRHRRRAVRPLAAARRPLPRLQRTCRSRRRTCSLDAAVTSCVAVPIYGCSRRRRSGAPSRSASLTLCGLRRGVGRRLDAAAALLRQGADARPAAQLLQLLPVRRGTLALPLVLGAAIGARRVRGVAPLRLRRPARVRDRAAARHSPHAVARRHAMERGLGARGPGSTPARRPRAAGRPARLVAAEGARARLRSQALFRCAAARPQLVADVRRRRTRVEPGERPSRQSRRWCRPSPSPRSPTLLFPFLLGTRSRWAQRGLRALPRADAAAAARLRRHARAPGAVRAHRIALAALRPGDDDRRARRRRRHRRSRRPAALRDRTTSPRASSRRSDDLCGGWRPWTSSPTRRPLPHQRVLLPRRHLAGDRGRPDRARRRDRDGPARLHSPHGAAPSSSWSSSPRARCRPRRPRSSTRDRPRPARPRRRRGRRADGDDGSAARQRRQADAAFVALLAAAG